MISRTKIIMGMPITVKIVDRGAKISSINEIFSYFIYVDKKFSTYKESSEISLINQGKIEKSHYSKDMQKVFKLSQQIKDRTDGYFNIYKDGKIDPSGLVKGWAIFNASKILKRSGFRNFYIEAGGDIQAEGKNQRGESWNIGIRNPFKDSEIVKVLKVTNKGVATSGTYLRGNHIYDPKTNKRIEDIVSLTVIGQNIFVADVFATACFAMGKQGINFLEKQKNLGGYMIDSKGVATLTSNFERYL